METLERKLSKNQTTILKALKRAPRTTNQTVDALNKAAGRRTGYAFASNPYSYGGVHSSLRRLENREYVRRIWRGKNTIWELTDKARDAL